MKLSLSSLMTFCKLQKPNKWKEGRWLIGMSSASRSEGPRFKL